MMNSEIPGYQTHISHKKINIYYSNLLDVTSVPKLHLRIGLYSGPQLVLISYLLFFFFVGWGGVRY